VIAHIMGAPVEELLTPLAGGVGAGVLLLARIWVVTHTRRG
jgi:hypothetical protein